MLEKNPATILLGVSLFLLNTFFPAVIAQNRSGGEVVVIEGATIIDGTGSGPQKGWIIVLGDGRIQDVGPAGQVRRPEQAIVSATRLPAEFLDRSEDLGTLEKGKIADLVILNRDPLQDIGNTQDIDAVFKDGQPVNLDYHRYLTSPLPRPTWMAVGTPTPHIASFPLSVSCSDSSVEVIIKGKNFRPQSFVRIDGVGQDIKYVSPTEITAELDCHTLNIPGTYVLIVVNPKPIQFNESEVSNPARFVVTR